MSSTTFQECDLLGPKVHILPPSCRLAACEYLRSVRSNIITDVFSKQSGDVCVCGIMCFFGGGLSLADVRCKSLGGFACLEV